MNPKYPVYIISKDRPSRVLTARELDTMNVPYRLVIEPHQLEEYSKYINPSKILLLPFSDLGQGSIPARNWVWEHSISEGHEKHWIMDDNIEGFHRLNRNMKPKVSSGTIFRCAEDFTDRFSNVKLSGLNYHSFCKTTDAVLPFTLNTRIYSCILIDNSIKQRWRGRYNEDTDLSLRVLKDGNCTILFNAFLAGKVTTMRMKGGNTDNVYTDDDNRLKFAQSLQKQHPDIVEVVWKFNRWHHQVNYKVFRQTPILKEGVILKKGINNYGMVLKDLEIPII